LSIARDFADKASARVAGLPEAAFGLSSGARF